MLRALAHLRAFVSGDRTVLQQGNRYGIYLFPVLRRNCHEKEEKNRSFYHKMLRYSGSGHVYPVSPEHSLPEN